MLDEARLFRSVYDTNLNGGIVAVMFILDYVDYVIILILYVCLLLVYV